MIDSIAGFFNTALSYIYMNISGHNYAVAILILTLLVKIVTLPLNNQQIQSAKRMQAIQPEIKRVQEKYKNDKEKQNKAVMELLQENKVNPMAGCLPLIIQFPILIGIFRLLSNPAKFGILDIPNFSSYLIPSFPLWGDLLSPDPYYIFPILSGISTFLYQRVTMTDPNQKMMMYMMPALITYLSFKFPMGLVLYWVLNNLFSLGQHYLVLHRGKSQGEPEPAKGKEKPKERKSKNK